jgi:hypothetical protein
MGNGFIDFKTDEKGVHGREGKAGVEQNPNQPENQETNIYSWMRTGDIGLIKTRERKK